MEDQPKTEKHRMKRHTKIVLGLAAVVAVVGITGMAVAKNGPWEGRQGMGHFMKGDFGMRAGMACSGLAQQKASRMLDRVADRVVLTEAQLAKLDTAKQAVLDSRAAAEATCAKVDFSKLPQDYPERLDRMEVGMTAMLQSLQASKPAINDFLASLSPEQQKELEERRSCGWRR